MPVALGVDASTAFQDQLRTLCLNEFPCGTGTWRTSTDGNVPGTRFAVTLKDYNALKEQEETLEELVTSKFSPYSVDYSWSDEAKRLREIAVKSPWVITETFIQKHFKTLRIIDKNVAQLDPDLLKLINLEELTLSANHIRTVHSQNIPKSVKVLELAANEIDDLEQLCEDPPELHHLGLGINKISAIHDYITGAYWPVLLSLDLSHNNLCDLIQIINTLSSLPKLRNLVLLGNPLALIPGYRGFTIDSLRKLSILDDLQISADEKHHYKGLARRKEYVLDEAKVTVTIAAAGGIPKPPEMLITASDDTPQYPITTSTYYVEFMFLEDFQAKAKAASAAKASAESKKGETKDTEKEKDVATKGDGTSAVATAQEDDKKEQPTIAIEKESAFFTQADSPSPYPTEPQDPPTSTPSQSPPPTLKLVPYRTPGLRWTEEGFEFKFSQDMVIDDLPALKEYFKRGIPLSVKEDKVLSTPVIPEEGSEESKSKSKDEDDFDDELKPLGGSRMGNNRSGASRMGNNRTAGASRMGNNRTAGASRMSNNTRSGGSVMGNNRTTGASRMGNNRLVGASRMSNNNNRKVGASRMGNNRTTGASRMGNNRTTGASRMGNARMGASRMGAASSMRSGSSFKVPAWPVDKKKKKKEPEVELIHSTPEVRVLGTYTLDLANFIDGEYLIENTCTCAEQGKDTPGVEEAVKEDEDGTDSKKEKKKKKERGESPKGKKGKGDGKESKTDKDKGKKQPLKPDKKESKAVKRPGSGKSQRSDDEDENTPPPPLTISISVELQHWKTAQDSLPKTTVADKMSLLEEAITE